MQTGVDGQRRRAIYNPGFFSSPFFVCGVRTAVAVCGSCRLILTFSHRHARFLLPPPLIVRRQGAEKGAGKKSAHMHDVFLFVCAYSASISRPRLLSQLRQLGVQEAHVGLAVLAWPRAQALEAHVWNDEEKRVLNLKLIIRAIQ